MLLPEKGEQFSGSGLSATVVTRHNTPKVDRRADVVAAEPNDGLRELLYLDLGKLTPRLKHLQEKSLDLQPR